MVLDDENGIYVFTNIAMEFRFSIRIIRSDAPRTKINGSYVASRISSSMTIQYEYSSNIGNIGCVSIQTKTKVEDDDDYDETRCSCTEDDQ